MAIAHKIFISKTLSNKLIRELKAADIKIEINKFIIRLLIAAFVLSFLILLIFFRDDIRFLEGGSFTKALTQYWLLSLFISILILLFFAYSLIVLRKYKRKKEVENVLADYLQLVSANLNAGMPIDQALWYAVRERFGILAEEIEIVARKTLAGVDLEDALIEFSQKYDSDMLKKAVVLLIEGMRAGGELATVVNKIAWSIKEDQILNREMSAEVMTYSIFIIFASLFAAPLFYALANRIIIIMAEVTSKISVENIVGVTTQIP
ncbi:MAG: type II secretion system F family protein, partial [Nanoarchaeota archaeon]